MTPARDCFTYSQKLKKDPATWTVSGAVPPGRPIVSDCNSATYIVSLYIDSFLGPLSTRHPSYLKDTHHFLDITCSLKLLQHLFDSGLCHWTRCGRASASGVWVLHRDKLDKRYCATFERSCPGKMRVQGKGEITRVISWRRAHMNSEDVKCSFFWGGICCKYYVSYCVIAVLMSYAYFYSNSIMYNCVTSLHMLVQQ